MHPLRQHTGICNSCGGGRPGGRPPFCFASLFFVFLPFWGVLICFFCFQQPKAARREAAGTPRTLGGDPVSGRGKTERGVVGSVPGGAGMETPGLILRGGHRVPPLPLRGPHFLIGFQRGAGPGGLSPAALVTGMEPCECSCASPGLVSGGSQPPPHLHPIGFIPGVQLARRGMAAGAFLSPLPAVPAAEQGPDTPPKNLEFALKPQSSAGWRHPPQPP